jgi:hypothetical protein
MSTTTDLADQARQLAAAAADLHVRLLEHGHDGPTAASAAWLALDRLADDLAAASVDHADKVGTR